LVINVVNPLLSAKSFNFLIVFFFYL